MDGLVAELNLEEFKIFYGLDCELYTILVRDLGRDPSECLQIMGLWLWLESSGFCNLISSIFDLDPPLVNWACDEAAFCLQLIMANHHLSTTPPDVSFGLPLTRHLLKTEAHLLQYFSENHLSAFHGVQNLVSDVCIPALSDIMEQARHGGFSPVPSPAQAVTLTLEDLATRGFSCLKITAGDSGEADLEEFVRTMFVTFTRGFPVTDAEVREFFRRLCGNCIESLHMQKVGSKQQALFARVLFVDPSYVHFILNGETKAMFSINGKRVWMSQFLPRNGKAWDHGCSSVEPSSYQY